MREALLILSLATLLAKPVLGAQDPEAMTAAREGNKTRAVALAPALGAVAFTESDDSITARAAIGVLLRADLTELMPEDAEMSFAELQSGAIFSHLGGTDANFLGWGSDNPATGTGANLLLFPLDIAVGWNTGPSSRLGIHIGGNVVFRSVGNAVVLGSPGQPGPAWTLLPNIGFDVEADLGKGAVFSFRPDMTINVGDHIYTGTVAVSFNLG